MASSDLPKGAFLTTIDGRRCTAVPRVASATTDTTNSAQPGTANSLPSQTTTASPTTGLVAAPAEGADSDGDESTAVEELSSTTSASTTSSSPATTTDIAPSSVQVAQAQENQSGPSLLIPTPLPAALLQASDATLQTLTVFVDVASSQESVLQSSQADSNVTAPAANVEASSSQTAAPEVLTSSIQPKSPAATPLLTVTESPRVPTDTVIRTEATARASSDPAVAAMPEMNSSAVPSTTVVAASVVGGAVALGIVAFFIWWWRRRLLRRRRSTLLTPLDAPSFGRDEKGAYVITRGSIGPTPVAVKIKAALGQNLTKIRGHFRNKTSPSVNLDRGTSQFIDQVTTHSRANSGIIGVEVAANSRLHDWWSRLTPGKNPNRGLSARTAGKNTRSQEVSALQKRAALGSQPDFLTLLGMDDSELDRATRGRRASIAHLNGNAGSADHFLSVLDVDLGSVRDNPFSDANAITHTSAKPAPLAVSQPNNSNSSSNPFSDANAIHDPPPPPPAAAAAIPKPASYVADIRRSRGLSANTRTAREPSTAYHTHDSVSSLGSLTTTTTAYDRNKFRSDPFDLDRPELLLGGGGEASITSSTVATAGSGRGSGSFNLDVEQQQQHPRRPSRAAHADSFTSRYTSDISVATLGGGWSDPGPDVGPRAAAAAAAASSSNANTARWPPREGEKGWRERELGQSQQRQQQQVGGNGGGRRRSSGGQGIVGMAM